MLSPLQEQVGRIVATLPEADGFALAGGAALVVTRIVDRATRDLDFFGPSADDVDRLVPAVESALVAAGLTVRRERTSHGFARLTVVAGNDATELDLAADARIRPVHTGTLGPMLSAEELGADKLLALFDRAQARDFVDVAALVDRFGLERLCELASEKDAGFSRSVLVEMGSFGRLRPAEFGMSQSAYDELGRAVEQWRQDLTVNNLTEPPGPGLDL